LLSLEHPPVGACAFLLELVFKHLPLASPVTCAFKYLTCAVVLVLLLLLLLSFSLEQQHLLQKHQQVSENQECLLFLLQ
jgi:TRAP-type C4-dicarboxylate transport system permease large subunit